MFSHVFSVLKRLLFRKAYVKFSLSLVALGLSCFVAPQLWEYIAALFVSIVQHLVPSWTPPPGSADNVIASYVAGAALIASGVVVFVIFFLREERIADAQNELSRYLRLTFETTNNWVVWTEEGENRRDVSCLYQIPFMLETGDYAVRIYSISVLRFVAGCECWDKFPRLSRRPRKEEYSYLGDNKYLTEPIRIEPHSSVNMLYESGSSGPTPDFSPQELEVGEFKFTIEYRFDADENNRNEVRFLKQYKGKLTEIAAISPPRSFRIRFFLMQKHVA